MKLNKGFTLVELLLAVSVVGILTGLVVSIINPSKQRQQATDGVRMANISKFAAALSAYYSEKGTYPSSTNVTSFSNSFANTYFESGIIQDARGYGGGAFISFVMPPDVVAVGDANRYIYRFEYDTANNRNIVRVVYTRTANIVTSGGICWAPDKNNGQIQVVSTALFSACITN